MRLLDEDDVKEINKVKGLLYEYIEGQFDKIYEEDGFIHSNYKICAYMASLKLIMIQMIRLFRRIGLKEGRGLYNLPVNNLSIRDYDYYEQATSECIVHFYEHYMEQLGYISDETDITYIIDELNDDSDTNIIDILEEYELPSGCADTLLSIADDFTSIEDGSIYIWHNKRVEDFLKNSQNLNLFSIGPLLDSVSTPVLSLFNENLPYSISRDEFVFSYILFLDNNINYEISVTGFDMCLSSLLDAVLLENEMMKVEQMTEKKSVATVSY